MLSIYKLTFLGLAENISVHAKNCFKTCVLDKCDFYPFIIMLLLIICYS